MAVDAALMEEYLELNLKLYARRGEVLVPLTQGFHTIVSEAHIERVKRHKWALHMGSGGPYARTTMYIAAGKKKTVYLHRFLTYAPDGAVVDHRNHATLDNRDDNLNVCGFGSNKQNSQYNEDTISMFGYRGVSVCGKKFRARYKLDGETFGIGVFPTPREAAEAYDAKMRELYGQFAWTNFGRSTAPDKPYALAGVPADAEFTADVPF